MILSDKPQFSIFEASAGTGKTYNLAKEYIKLCIKYSQTNIYKNILAITFTNKAVGEMKERILRFLKEIPEGKQNDLLIALKNELDISEEEIKKRCKESLSNILHNYNNFSICTIDSFFQKIVQAFAIELDIPLHAQVELSEKTLINQIIENLMARIGENGEPDLNQIVLKFLETQLTDNKSWKIDDKLKKDGGQNLFSENTIPYLEKNKGIQKLSDFQNIISNLFKQRNNIDFQLKQLGQEAIGIIQQYGLTREDFNRGTLYNCFDNFANGEYKTFEKSQINSNTLMQFRNGDTNGCNKASEKKYSTDLLNDMAEKLRKKYENILKQYGQYVSIDMILKHIYSVALLQEMHLGYEKIKQQKHLTHISEANVKLAKHIKEEPIPFVYEKMGTKYKYFFIDEFQDTSGLQWDSLRPLLEEATATNGHITILGDPKQAIYRFRSGKVELINTLSEMATQYTQGQYPTSDETVFNNHTAMGKITLDTNYRSYENIVTFNNQYFKELCAYFQSENIGENNINKIYSELNQKAKENNKGGLVQLSLIQIDKDISDTDSEIHSEIKRIIEQSQNLGYKWEDIAILVRENKHGAEIAQFLLANNIDIISSEALLLKNDENIRFIISILQYINNPQNEIAKANILLYIAAKQTLESNNNFLKHAKDTDIEQVIQKYYPQFNLLTLQKKDWYQKTELLYHIFGLDNTPNPYLLAFLNFIATFSNQQQYEQHQFFDYWEEKKDNLAIVSPENINAVTIMTSHKSKGLEFPIVIYPIYEKGNKNTKLHWVNIPQDITTNALKSTNIDFSKRTALSVWNTDYQKEIEAQLLDDINIDYVVFTRAKNHLHIIKTETIKDEDSNKKEIFSLKNYLKTFFSSIIKEQTTLEEDNNIIRYTYGQSVAKEQKQTAQCEQKWITKTQSLPIQAKIQTHRIKQLAEASAWGDLIHAYLSQIVYIEDIKICIESIKKQKNLATNEKIQLENIINKLFCPQYQKLLFGPDKSIIRNEVEINNLAGKIRRIDRLIISDKNVYIIDYKTGKEYKKTYEDQIKEYAEILTQMGYIVKSTTLIYISKEDNEIKINPKTI